MTFSSGQNTYLPTIQRQFPNSTTSKWVVENIIDPLTEGRHSLLREASEELIKQRNVKPPSFTADPRQGTVATQVTASLYLFPATLIAFSSLLHIGLHKIDMAALLKSPQDLFLSEEEWAGRDIKEKRRLSSITPKIDPVPPSHQLDSVSDAMEVEEPEQTWVGVDADVTKAKTDANRRLSEHDMENSEELREVLEYVAKSIIELNKRIKLPKTLVKRELKTNSNGEIGEMGQVNGHTGHDSKIAIERSPSSNSTPLIHGTEVQSMTTAAQSGNGFVTLPESQMLEDPALRNLRLNLLALAKRAPLDTIARLPKDLVPEHIRHFVPTFGSSG